MTLSTSCIKIYNIVPNSDLQRNYDTSKPTVTPALENIQDPVAITESILNAEVELIDDSFSIINYEDFNWQNVVFKLNISYYYNMDIVEHSSSFLIKTSNFYAAGVQFPQGTEVTSLMISASTPHGTSYFTFN